MRLVYKVYPAALWLFSLLIWLGGVRLGFAFRHPWVVLVTLFLWPIPSAALAGLLAGLLTIPFPRIRYVNEAEIDGLGYVHQPYDVLVPFLMMAFLSAVVALVTATVTWLRS